MKRPIALALVVTSTLGLAFAAPQEREAIQVESRSLDGELLLSVRANDKPLDNIIEALADEAGMRVSGFDGRRQRLITVDLYERPLDMVLEFTLGSVGLDFTLEGNHITISGHDATDRDALLRAASRGYQRALNTFPSAEAAPAAHLSQAWIAEQNGDLGSAIAMYQMIPSTYPGYPELAAAEFHSARLYEELGNWRDAIQHYDRLAELKIDHDFHAAQRLGRARCTIELGDPKAAIFQLQNLDLHSPALDDDEAAQRILVRARANNARRDYQAALADLDQIDQLQSYLVRSADYQRNTAIALEGLELFGPAARAWLAYAERALGNDRLTAVELAVELFLDANDESAALYAIRFGETLGGSPKLTALSGVIDERLGLVRVQPTKPTSEKGPAERLERARAAWQAGDLSATYSALGPVMNDSRGLIEVDRAEVLCLWARCLDRLEGLDAAIDVLRTNRPQLTSLENRMRLDVVAADLYEAHGRFDEAVDAYGGTYR
ncbi:MAG: tetratricopeptide repeat protein [Planctomycetota bacterium]|nr:tetratricopeptide repeat protein [Planctomycetota bacterium]